MSEGKRGARRGQRPAQGPSGVQESAQSAGEPSGAFNLTTFPIRFVDAYLYDLRVTRFPEHDANANIQGGALNVEIAQPRIDNQILQVGVKLRIQVPNEEAPAWSIEATMNGVFEIAEGTPEELVQAFVPSTTLPLVWPYLRELLQSLSIRMRVPPLLLPTIDTREPLITQPPQETPRDEPDDTTHSTHQQE